MRMKKRYIVFCVLLSVLAVRVEFYSNGGIVGRRKPVDCSVK